MIFFIFLSSSEKSSLFPRFWLSTVSTFSCALSLPISSDEYSSPLVFSFDVGQGGFHLVHWVFLSINDLKNTDNCIKVVTNIWDYLHRDPRIFPRILSTFSLTSKTISILEFVSFPFVSLYLSSCWLNEIVWKYLKISFCIERERLTCGFFGSLLALLQDCLFHSVHIQLNFFIRQVLKVFHW